MDLMSEGRGLMFLSGLLLGMGILFIIWATLEATPACTDPEIPVEREIIQVSTISTAQ